MKKGNLFTNLRISTKIILSSVFFLIPMGIMLIISLTGIRYDIRFSTLELYGNQYQQPLESLLKNIQNYHTNLSLGRVSDGESSAKAITDFFSELREVQEEVGEDLQFTEEGLRIRGRDRLKPDLLFQRWQSYLKNHNEQEYIALIEDIREMISHSGDTSNLILDPDLDSYYLMDLSLLVLPQTQQRLGEIIQKGTEMIQRAEKDIDLPGVLSEQEKQTFYVYAKFLEESDYSRIKGSTETAVNEDPNFYGIYEPMQQTIPLAFEEYKRATLKFLEALYALASSESLPFSSDAYFEMGATARNQSFTYWNRVVKILDDLLEIRIASYKQIFMKYLISSLLTLVCAIVIFLLIRKDILRSIASLKKAFERATQNDLTTRITIQSKDEIADCAIGFNQLLQKFSELMLTLQSLISVLKESVQNQKVTSQQVFSTSNNQAASVKEIVTTMEDSDSLSKSIAEKISQISNMAEETAQSVKGGFEIIQKNIEKMDEIRDSNDRTKEGIQYLSERIENIWEIVNLINGIADQTKIIAFNAELEASSAGEAGKSFQLVATEIRRLADGTVSSTAEIKSRINEIQKSSDALIVSSEEGTLKISEGNTLTREMNRVFEGILNSSEKTTTSTNQISQSIHMQVSSFEQILLTLRQISEGIDNFVVATRESTTSVETLKEMAEDLESRIEMYRA